MNSLKYVIFLLCFCFVISSHSLWQSLATSGEIMIQKQETLNIQKDKMNKMERIVFIFCNSWFQTNQSKLEIKSRPWEHKEICIIFGNKNTEKVDIIMWFPNWWEEKKWKILCNADITWKNQITNLMNEKSKANLYFSLAPKEQVIKKFYIKIPDTQTWNIFWCWSFKIKWNLQLASSWGMFNIEIVKKIPIQINITWSIYQYQWIDDLNYSITDNKENILKWFIAIVWLRLIISIIQSASKKKHSKHNKK